ncbi:interleukin-6 receptor subunit alpha [Oryzias melastigma]|uniref:Interleukin-6 receptor subunit alpha-like n=1 Tax=Oryzias melastigma TaxID=30732 RepID=A0A3B3D581_ORYME|nr:interleukin-6 receptor subunit alpha [Oryzias melastigma]
MRTFLLLLGFVRIGPIWSFFEGACPRKDPPPGVLVLSPGSRLVLTCSGLVKVNGEKVILTRTGPHANSRRTSTAKVPTVTHNSTASTTGQKPSMRSTANEEHQHATSTETLKNTVNKTSPLMVQPTSSSRTAEDKTDWENEEMDTEGGVRVTRGVRWRPQWKWNKLLVGRGGRDWGEIKVMKGGETLCLPSVRASDSGRFMCHRGGTETFALKVVVADPPERPSLSCYKKAPKSKIRCEWKPLKTQVKQPSCFLSLSKGSEKAFQQIPCSSSPSRCWCAVDYNEDDQGTLHLAFLCATSIVGNATSEVLHFKPMEIVKPDPPSNILVHQQEGHSRRIEVTWNRPTTWPQDNYYGIIYELKYRPSISLHEQVNLINGQQSYSIHDALSGLDYVIQLRSKEEYEGRWSEWSSPVYARSWNETKTEDPAFSLDSHEKVNQEVDHDGSGSGWDPDNTESSTADARVYSCIWLHHIVWVSGLFAVLSVILVLYIFRHKVRIMSKLHRMGVFSKCGGFWPSSPSDPAPPEGKALVTFSPQLLNKQPPSDPQEEENEEEETLTDRIEAMHFNNNTYFFLQRQP